MTAETYTEAMLVAVITGSGLVLAVYTFTGLEMPDWVILMGTKS